MDLDATRHKKITEEEKKRRLRDHLYLYCGNEGHTAWNYPNKRNPSKKNFNHQLRAIQETQPSHETKKIMVATQLGKHLQLTAKIANHSATTLLDSGATGNFMDPGFQKKIGILGELKAKPTLI
jgi:6-phosphogluconolactonase/glucosamine-6-phosphate isomerase/deaminase